MKQEVIVYMEDELISLEVVIPKKYSGDFIVEFGNEFAINTIDGGPEAKRVDEYFSHPAGWHVRVSVDLSQRVQLYQFLRNFCEKRNLSFRDSENS